MTIPNGTRVHVCAVNGYLGLGTIEATWFVAEGVPQAYHVGFDNGALSWVDTSMVMDVSAIADRNPAFFSSVVGQA